MPAPPPLTEKQWQQVVVDTARLYGWRVYHTFDSRRSSPGFPDLVLARERMIYAELKTEKGKLSAAQVEWMHVINDAGGEFYVWRPSDRFEVDNVLRTRMPAHV